MLLETLDSVATVPLLVVLAACGITAVTDVRSFRIPNYVTLPLFVAGLLFHAILPGGNGIGFSLLGGAVGFGCLILFHFLGGIGAGDVKLLAAVGTWIGPGAVFVLFLAAALLLGACSLAITWWHGTLQKSMQKVAVIFRQGAMLARYMGEEERVEEVVKQDDRRRRLVPFAVMVLGGIAILLVFKFIH